MCVSQAHFAEARPVIFNWMESKTMMGYSIEDTFKAFTIYPFKFLLEGIHLIKASKKAAAKPVYMYY